MAWHRLYMFGIAAILYVVWAPCAVASKFPLESKAESPKPGQITSVEAGWLPRYQTRTASSLALAASATPSSPFTECPAVGNDTSCGLLVDVTDSGVSILQDPSQGPYDGIEDTLVGVLNQSSKTLGHLSLASNTSIFGFDGDGICAYEFDPGCPFGPTGYEGPGTSFTETSGDLTSGVVSFNPPISPGGSAYFSLEEPLSSSTVVSGGPSLTEQGGAPNRSEHHSTCSTGRPVNCATGAFWHEFTDTSIPGRGVPLEFTRTYSSMNAATDGPLGFGWTDSYNMSLTLEEETGAATIHEEGGSAVTFPSNSEGGFTTPPRVLATLVANEDGTYTFSRYSDHIQYVFSESGQLLREVDRNGNTTTLSYSSGLLAGVTDPSGRSLTFTYTGSRIHTITDPVGRTTTFAYDLSGNLKEAIDPLGRNWSFTYDAEHRLLTMTDPRGGTTTNTYDSSGRVIAQVDPLGRKSTWSYEGDPTSPEGGSTIFTDARGDATLYEYQNLELMSVSRGYETEAEATTSYSYDPITLGLTTIIDPDGNETHNHYDSHGNLVESSDPLGRTSYYEYGFEDELLAATDPAGTTTTYVYDGAGNLLEKETPLYETGEFALTTYAYEGAPGELTSVTDPDGHTIQIGYDKAGDRTSVTNADGKETTYVYNADGERTSMVSPAGNEAGGNAAAHTTSYVYDADGERTSETNPLGHTTTFGYDATGNRTAVTDPNGHMTKEVYDADNELTKVIRPDGSILKTEWDAAGNITTQIDGAGHATTYAYDALSRLTSVTDPNDHTTSYGYDPAGNKTEVINAEGEVTEYGYDPAGELVSIEYSDGITPSVYMEYDADGNRTELYDGTGISTFTYDSLNRMTSATDGGGTTVAYEYDLACRLTGLTYPNGKSVKRSYDPAGNLTGVEDWLGHTTKFAYGADSNLEKELYPNGVVTQRTYDNADRLEAITDTRGGTQLAAFSYTRDAAGQLASESVENGESETVAFSRNSLDQLTAANGTLYGYDAADNPTTFGQETTQQFDPANELTTAMSPGEVPKEEEQKEEGKEEGGKGGEEEQGGGPKGPSEEPHSEPAASPTVDGEGIARLTKPRQLTSRTLHAQQAGDLLTVFVSAAGSGQRVDTVSGGGLRWSKVAHQGGAGGTSEIWQARASGRFSGRVTIGLIRKTRFATATIVAFTNNAYVSSQAASRGHRSLPLDRITAPPGAVVWGVGHSSGESRRPAATPGQALVSQFFNRHTRLAGWVQNAGTVAGDTALSIASPSTHWMLLGVAIASGGAQAASVTRASASVASAGHHIASDVGIVTRNFSYNARGDRTSEEVAGGITRLLTYDQADRLVEVNGNIEYAYNGDGLRTSKTVNGITGEFVWNQAELLPELLQDASTYYIYGPEGEPIEQITGTTATYLHGDQQGSTRLLTNGTGNVIGRYDYNPWGSVVRHSGSAATNLQYDGQYTDSETGYQYLRARYYDPATGQFLTADPAFAATWSRHGFTGNDPLDATDATGLSWYNPFSWSPNTWKTIGEVAGVAGVVAGGVALCAATACLGDAAVAAIGGSATLAVIGEGAETVGLGAAALGGLADGVNIYNDCIGHRRYSNAGECGTDIAVGAIDAATFGFGNLAFGGKFVANETRTIIRNAIGLGGGTVSLLVSSRFWVTC